MRAYLSTLLASLFLCSAASADVIWDYESTDGADTITGKLRTDGNAADVLMSGITFNLLEITNVFLNGTEIIDWGDDGFGSGPPPFTNVAGANSITTTGTTGAALQDQVQLLAASGGLFFNSVALGQAGVPNGTGVSFDSLFGIHTEFTPTSTTFQAEGTGVEEIPEPSSLLYLGLVGTGLVIHRRRKRRA